jgi:hypothetical protein
MATDWSIGSPHFEDLLGADSVIFEPDKTGQVHLQGWYMDYAS